MDIELDAPIDELEMFDDDLEDLGDGPASRACSQYTN
jgi:hypothetical protein